MLFRSHTMPPLSVSASPAKGTLPVSDTVRDSAGSDARRSRHAKGGIVCDQPHIAGLECLQQFIRYDFSRCKVCTSCLAKAIPFIGCPGYQQDFKAGICGLAVQTAFSDIHLAVGLNIDQYLFQKITPYLRKNRETPLHLPACSFTCVLETPGLTSDNPAVPHRHRRPEHPQHLRAEEHQWQRGEVFRFLSDPEGR